MSYPDDFDAFSKPTATTIRHATGGQSLAGTMESVLYLLEFIESRIGLAPATVAFTADAGTDLLTSASHGLADHDIVYVSSTGALPGGLATRTRYFVVSSLTNTFQLAATRGGSAIDITGAGTGTHSFRRVFSEGKFLAATSSSRSDYTKAVPSGAIVGDTDTQTLSGKTLTDPTINAGGGTIVLPQSSSIAPTVEGSIGWDTDDNLLKIGTSGGTKTFVDTDSTQTLAGKTLTTPTIASFTNANHNHQNSAGGGTLAAAAMPNLALNTQALSNPYKMRASLGSAHDSGNAAFAKITLGVEEYDTNGNHAAGTYTVAVSGFYDLLWLATSAASASTWIASIFKNGAEVSRGEEKRTALNPNSSRGSDQLQLAANDTIELHVFGNSAIALQTGSDRTYMAIKLSSHT